MARVVRQRKPKARRLYGLILLCFLLAAAGAGLYRYPPSLPDIGKTFRLAADKILGKSADPASAEPVLRGTIFDRAFRELAVSYPLYSVYVRPGKVDNLSEVIRVVAETTKASQASVEAQLKQAHQSVKVADNLEAEQVREILARPLAGVEVKPVEERFYPAHEAAAGLIGYVGDGIGLAGVEGVYDIFLQHGEFRGETLPEIDFRGRTVIGRSTVDAVLTLDLPLQKEMEGLLRDYLQDRQAERGLAICLDVKTGAVRAWAGRPSYNPNYFWQLADGAGAAIFQETLDPALYRDILVRAAALTKSGELGDPLPPDSVAADNYGLSEEEVAAFAASVGLAGAVPWRPLPDVLDIEGGYAGDQAKAMPGAGVNALQLARSAASMVNGGWYLLPHVLGGVYAHQGRELFSRSAAYDEANRRRIVSPAMGIRLRRELFEEPRQGVAETVPPGNGEEQEKMIVHSASAVRMFEANEGNGYVLQDMLLGVIPAKAPVLLLLMFAQRDALYPLSATTGRADRDVDPAGKMLPTLLAALRETGATAPPEQKDPANHSQFLISRRMDFQERPGGSVDLAGVMPEVTGVSLRKGLQRLNPYHLLVNIEGTGRIVRQSPPAGAPLQGVGECTLILESKR